MERDNSHTRHHLARRTRKTKGVSQSADMVDASCTLWCALHLRDHRGTTEAQISLKQGRKPTVPTSQCGRQSSLLSESSRLPERGGLEESSGQGPSQSSGDRKSTR